METDLITEYFVLDGDGTKTYVSNPEDYLSRGVAVYKVVKYTYTVITELNPKEFVTVRKESLADGGEDGFLVTQEWFGKLEEDVKRKVRHKTDKRLRDGQIVFNEFYQAFKELGLSEIPSTFINANSDCYYNDIKIPKFINRLYREVLDKRLPLKPKTSK